MIVSILESFQVWNTDTSGRGIACLTTILEKKVTCISCQFHWGTLSGLGYLPSIRFKFSTGSIS